MSSQVSRPTPSTEIEETRDLRADFFHMSIAFGIGHGTATTPLVYASSALDPEVGYLSNGILYVLMLLSSLLFAVPTIGRIGLKDGLVASLALYAGYVGTFSLAATSTSPAVQKAFFLPGSICGGLAAGLIWTAQGGYLSYCATAVAAKEEKERTPILKELQTQFAFYYLLFEVLAKVIWSVLMAFGGINVPVVGAVYAALAIVSSVLMVWVSDVPNSQSDKAMGAQLLAATRLWSDVRIWLISPTNITFGVAAAFMNGFFNAQYAKPVLGEDNIGFLAAFTVICSCTMSRAVGFLGHQFGNFIPLCIGGAAFAGIPLLMFGTSCCQHWGWWIAVFYALQGTGRAVFENTNKVLFAETYPGADAEGAFATSTLQLGLSSAVCFFLSGVASGQSIEISVLIFALLMPTLYIAKKSLDKDGSEASATEASPLVAKSA